MPSVLPKDNLYYNVHPNLIQVSEGRRFVFATWGCRCILVGALLFILERWSSASLDGHLRFAGLW